MPPKYDKIGTNYNRTRKADPYLTKRLLFYLRKPDKNGLYLDIGCGTGNYTIEIQKQGFNLIGIDPSRKMLDEAKSKNSEIDWRIGTAENTGLPSASVDGVIGSLTIHHWQDLEEGFSESHRVLKKNGSIVIFTSTPLQMKGYWLNHYFPNMLNDSITQMPSYPSVEAAMKKSGFEIVQIDPYFIHPNLEDQFLYCGKKNPELYFDEDIRHGISSFSSLANQEEVKKGLAALRKDIDSGHIDEVVKSYENELGDYLYIIGKKASN